MRHAWRDWLALAGVVVVAAWLRFAHLDWDQHQLTHPDERYVLFVASSLDAPENVGEVLRPRQSPLNPLREDGRPRPYPYGHAALYATLAGRAMVAPLLHPAHPDRLAQLTLVGRGLSALADTLTVVVAGLLGRRLYGVRSGLVAAAFGALAVLHIQQAHFATVDAMLALFATLTLYFLVRATSERPQRRRAAVLAGISAGLAIGSKASGLLLVAPLAAAHIRRADGQWRVRPILWPALGAMGLTFALTNPYVLLDFSLFARDVATQAALVRGLVDAAFTRQFDGAAPIGYYVVQQARWGLGLPLTVVSYAGLGWAMWTALRGEINTRDYAPLLVWAWANMVVVGTQFVKFPRYMLPMTPILFVFAAGLLNRTGRARWVLVGVVLALTGVKAVGLTRMYKQAHPWLAASHWIYEQVPDESILAVETGDDALPLDLETNAGTTLAAAHYDQRALDPYSADRDLESFLGDLSAADYYVIASNRLYGVVPRLDDRYPLGAAFYRELFAGRLGFELEGTFARYPDVFGLALVDDPFARADLPMPDGFAAGLPEPRWDLGNLDESFTVYDHPLVMLFRNEERLSADALAAIIRAAAAEP